MLTLTPDLYVAPATKGAYIIHRLTGPTQTYVKKHSTFFFQGDTTTGWMCPLVNAGGGHAIGEGINYTQPCIVTSTGLLAPAFSCFDLQTPPTSNIGLDGSVTFGVAIFRGLHYLATVTVKSCNDLELIPSELTPSKNFTRNCPPPDIAALNAYYALAHALPAVLPSKDNFLGSVLPVVGSLLSKAIPYIRTFLGGGVRAAAPKVVRSIMNKVEPRGASAKQIDDIWRNAMATARTANQGKQNHQRKQPKPKRAKGRGNGDGWDVPRYKPVVYRPTPW